MVGTKELVYPIRGASTIGLVKGTMSVEGKRGLTQPGADGVTYVPADSDMSEALTVVHVSWDGEETWRASVPRPAAAKGAEPRISVDELLGVVSFWFSSAKEDMGDVAGPITWFRTSTGETGRITPTASPAKSWETLVGYLHQESETTTNAADTDFVEYLNTSYKPQRWSWDGYDASETVGPMGSFGGQLATMVTTNPASKTWTVKLGASTLASGFREPGSTMIPAGVFLFMAVGNKDLVIKTPDGKLVLDDTQGCTVDKTQWTDGTNLSGASPAYAWSGGLVLDRATGKTRCLSSFLQPHARISLVLPSGDVISAVPNPQNDRSWKTWVLHPGAMEGVSMSLGDLPDLYGEHVAFALDLPRGTTAVSAFALSDLSLPS